MTVAVPPIQDAMDRVRLDTRQPGRPPDSLAWASMSQAERDAYAAEHYTPEEWAEILGKMEKAMVQLIVHFPFFGFMAAQMADKRVWIYEDAQNADPRGPLRTMATDGHRLYIWPGFVLYHNQKQLMGVILHELFHNMLFHPMRGAGYHPVGRNLAMDYAVNLMVNDAARDVAGLMGEPMSPALYDRLAFYVPVDPIVREDGSVGPRFCYDEKYRDEHGNAWLWEDIYHDIVKEADGAQAVTVPGELLDDHGPWMPGARPEDADGSAEENAEGQGARFDPDKVQRWAMDANAKCTSGEMKGSMPSGLKRMIQEWLYPPLPWYKLLQRWMRFAPADWSWVPGDVRFPQPMPCIAEEPSLTYVTFGFDTSGSMGPDEISASVENARQIMRGFPAMKGRAYFWDAAVHDRMDLEDFEGVYDKGVGGGGGTSIRPQFEAVAEDGITPQQVSVHVCFTDGYVDWDAVDPDALGYDVLWVITNDTQVPPEHPRYTFTRLSVK